MKARDAAVGAATVGNATVGTVQALDITDVTGVKDVAYVTDVTCAEEESRPSHSERN